MDQSGMPQLNPDALNTDLWGYMQGLESRLTKLEKLQVVVDMLRAPLDTLCFKAARDRLHDNAHKLHAFVLPILNKQFITFVCEDVQDKPGPRTYMSGCPNLQTFVELVESKGHLRVKKVLIAAAFKFCTSHEPHMPVSFWSEIPAFCRMNKGHKAGWRIDYEEAVAEVLLVLENAKRDPLPSVSKALRAMCVGASWFAAEVAEAEAAAEEECVALSKVKQRV